MHIGILTITLHIPGSHSLKEKRHLIKSLCERIKHRYNVSVSEIDHQDKWQLAMIGIAYINSDMKMVQKTIDQLLEFTYTFSSNCLITHHTQEIL